MIPFPFMLTYITNNVFVVRNLIIGPDHASISFHTFLGLSNEVRLATLRHCL